MSFESLSTYYKAALSKLVKLFRPTASKKISAKKQIKIQPIIISRNEHPISRKAISSNALKVIYRLSKSGYEAYFVGGSVRDLMLGREPKDFDIVTNARPEEIRKIFRNCRLIGKRFRLAHIYFNEEIIEVATFRAGAENRAEDSVNRHGMVLRDNIYGQLEDDVWRRDFTINALYYNIANFSIVDYVQGTADINHGIIRIIGDPKARYREDPVRMLRAIRFAAKLSFSIEKNTADAILELAPLLKFVSNARLFDETIKLFLSGHAARSFTELRHFSLFKEVFPFTDNCLNDKEYQHMVDVFIVTTLNKTDERVSNNQTVNPAFLYATFLWYPLIFKMNILQSEGMKTFPSFEMASNGIIAQQMKYTALPRKLNNIIRDIWSLQYHLVSRQGRRPFKLLRHPQFRAAYDFLVTRTVAEPELTTIADWWTTFSQSSPKKQERMILQLKRANKKHI